MAEFSDGGPTEFGFLEGNIGIMALGIAVKPEFMEDREEFLRNGENGGKFR